MIKKIISNKIVRITFVALFTVVFVFSQIAIFQLNNKLNSLNHELNSFKKRQAFFSEELDNLKISLESNKSWDDFQDSNINSLRNSYNNHIFLHWKYLR